MHDELLTLTINGQQAPQLIEAMNKAGYKLFELGVYPKQENHVILTFETPEEK